MKDRKELSQYNENDLQVLRVTIKKLIDKMKQSGIDAATLYESYAKSITTPLHYEKFERLFLKINGSLTK